MARPEKRKVDYFPHQIKNGKTLFVLESEFGNNGYAFWFKLLEILGQSDNHYYDCNEPGGKRFLVAKVKIDEEIVDKMLEILYDLKAIDQELWREHKIIWSQNFVDNVADVYKRRNCEIPLKPCFNENGELMSTITPPPSINVNINPTETPPQELMSRKSNNNDILNYIKLNETKLDETKKITVKKNFDLKSIPYQLAYYLTGKIKEGNKAFIIKGEEQLQSWAYDFDLMIRIDKREPKEIAYIIKFATEDSFWSGNILSASKLRIQYAQLWKKSKGKYDSSKPIDIGNILKKEEIEIEKRNV
jgi:hypothetical protein